VFDFIGRRRIWFAISLAIIVVGMGFWAARGLNIGIDFRGGNILELRFSTAQTTSAVGDVFTANGLTDASIQVIGEGGQDFLIRTQHVSEEARQKLYSDLRTACGEFQEIRFESVSPLIGKERRGVDHVHAAVARRRRRLVAPRRVVVVVEAELFVHLHERPAAAEAVGDGIGPGDAVGDEGALVPVLDWV
jgi:hypothetical protein